MNKSEILLAIIVAGSLAAGCVTTTTTTSADAEADEENAAALNYQLGAQYLRNGNYERARDRLLLSIELDPKNAVAHYTLALVYENLENMRLATESYEDAIRIAPRDFNVQNAYAVFLCKQRDFENARKHFDRAIRVPENDNAHITMTNAGVCLMQKPDADVAEQYFRDALQRKGDYGEALIQLSLLKYTTEDYMSARAFLQRFLSTNAPSSGVLLLGVRIEEELGDERARTDYANQILREFPESAEARSILESS
ncbi:MAG: type IV pilus biogenesis/stability protein PilW [Woeseiaceae bacterium]|nr:type IV pilus biogenesis/stability protein PilW [Woeseiaceae bacterium]